MAGKTAAKAVDAFVGPIQEALGCFADGKVTITTKKLAEPGNLAFNGGRPTALNGSGRPRITCAMKYEVVETEDESMPFKVHTTNYIYRLMGRQGRPIVDYHWHPADTADIQFPHLHVRELKEKRHHPTGRVLVEDVLVLAALELGALPRDKTKWDRILARNRANFAKGATWGTSFVLD